MQYMKCHLFHVLSIIREMHVTLTDESVMERECCRQVVMCLTALCNLELIPQELLVIGMSAVLDDALCTLHRTLATKVGNTLLGDDDIDIVLGVVVMTYHRHDRADGTVLCH